jgi:tetratricopeptide (TPR) repeat protein
MSESVKLDALLTQIEQAQLARRSNEPDRAYLFKHALVQEAAYASLLKQDRRRLHRLVGEALERQCAERVEDYAPQLGQHFDAAGDDARALRYFTLAGDAAARVYANTEAAAHYTCALRSAERVGASGDRFIHLYTSRGQALELNGLPAEALTNYAEMETSARARGDRALELAALMARAKILATPNPEQDPAQAQPLLEQALTLARELDDRATESKVLWNLMILLVWSGGDQRRAVAYGEASRSLARELNLREQLAFCLNDLSYAYMATDEWRRAEAAAAEARDLWRELGNQPMLADCLGNSVIAHIRAGRFDQAIADADEARRISRSIGNVWGQASSGLFIGPVYLERGQVDQAIQTLEETIPLGEQVGHATAYTMTRADLGWVYASLGQVQRGIELARLAQTRAANLQLSLLRMHPNVVLARLHVLEGDLDAAEAALRQGYGELRPEGIQAFEMIILPIADAELALARHDAARAVMVINCVLVHLHRTQAYGFIAETHYLKGKALLALSQPDRAYQVLSEARAEAEATGSRRMLWPILTALSKIESLRNHHVEAHALRRQAREIVDYIAGHTPAQWRASFLDLPDVRDVMRDT